jgi:hypothetical protein
VKIAAAPFGAFRAQSVKWLVIRLIIARTTERAVRMMALSMVHHKWFEILRIISIHFI